MSLTLENNTDNPEKYIKIEEQIKIKNKRLLKNYNKYHSNDR